MKIVNDWVRAPVSRGTRCPLVVLWGARGGAVHGALRAAFTAREPHRPAVFIRSARASPPIAPVTARPQVARDPAIVLPPDLRPWQIARVLASRLSEPVPGFGRLRFPRLLLGVLVVQEPTGVLDDDETRQRVQHALAERTRSRNAVLRWIDEVAPDLLDLAGLAPPLGPLLRVVTKLGLSAVRLRPVQGRGLRWYRGDEPSMTTLIQLGHRASQSTPDATDEVDRLLCEAFLADLTAEFRRARWWLPPSGSVLVVVEGADEAPMRDFLGILARLEPRGVPLVVLAGAETRGPRHPRYDPQPDRWPARDLTQIDQISWDDWASARDRLRGWRAFYPLELTRPVPATVGTDRRVEFVDRLARGHPLGAAVIAPVAAGVSEPAALRDIFALDVAAEPVDGGEDELATAVPTSSTAASRRVGAVLLDAVVGTWSPDIIDVLIRAAAVPDLSDDNLDRARDHQPSAGAGLVQAYRDRDLWVTRPLGVAADGAAEVSDDEPAVLHPLARRVLLHRLAQHGMSTGQGWTSVHDDLRALAYDRHRSASSGREQKRPSVVELYHDLAAGRVHEVATELTSRFHADPVAVWFADLRAVVAAPVRDPSQRPSAEEVLQQLAHDRRPDPRVRRELVAALQLHTDPLGDPGHDLCLTISELLRELGEAATAGRAFLTERAEEFRGCWGRFHEKPGGG